MAGRQKTPTHEQLAVQLDVNPATIAKAISLLADEGLVKRSRRSGTVVIAKPVVTQAFPRRFELARISEQLRNT